MELAWRVVPSEFLVVEYFFLELAGARCEAVGNRSGKLRGHGGQDCAFVANGRGWRRNFHRRGVRRGFRQDFGGFGKHLAGRGDGGDVVGLGCGFGRGGIDDCGCFRGYDLGSWFFEDRRALAELGAGKRVDAVRGRGGLGLVLGFDLGDWPWGDGFRRGGDGSCGRSFDQRSFKGFGGRGFG